MPTMRQEGLENVSSLYIERGTTGCVRHHVLNGESVYLRRQYRTVVQLVWISPRQSYLAAIHVLQPHASSHSQCLPVPRRTSGAHGQRYLQIAPGSQMIAIVQVQMATGVIASTTRIPTKPYQATCCFEV
jgi:hypothetical protein